MFARIKGGVMISKSHARPLEPDKTKNTVSKLDVSQTPLGFCKLEKIIFNSPT